MARESAGSGRLPPAVPACAAGRRRVRGNARTQGLAFGSGRDSFNRHAELAPAPATPRAARSIPRSAPSPSLPSASMIFRIERSPSSKLQQTGDDSAIRRQLAISQQPQQVFAGVRQFFQAREAQKSGGSLDGVHRAEDVREQACVRRPRSPARSGTAPSGPGLPGSRSGTPLSVRPFVPIIRWPVLWSAPGMLHNWFIGESGNDLREGQGPGFSRGTDHDA